MNPYLLLALSALVVVAACTTTTTDVATKPSQQPAKEQPQLAVEDSEIKTLPDGTKYLIHPSEIVSGGPPKDGIPSIDSPDFVSVAEADKWLSGDELGAAVIHKGVKRFYPFQILVWHEIVNENLAGDAIMITYCPLCGSVIGYNSTLDGEPVEFGTSGKLYNSNLVMYDRKTDSYWTQIEGRAVVGPLTGMELELFPVDVVAWQDWKSAYPGSEVLSRKTGHVRAYGTDPYGSYYTSRQTIFPVDKQDDRLHPKAVVFGVVVNGTAKAYPEEVLKQQPGISDNIGGVSVTVARDNVGIATITDDSSGSRIPHERDFWFAWYAFHPDTALYTAKT